MRIRSIVASVVEVPMVRPFQTAHGVFTGQRSAVVEVSSDQGLSGWGEVDPVPGYSHTDADLVVKAINGAASALVELDPENLVLFDLRLQEVLGDDLYARSAVDMAAHDLVARAAGKPLSALLGGNLRVSIPLGGWIGWETPERAAAVAREWVDRGFGGVKVKIGSGPAEDEARVAAVRAEIGPDVHLRVDAGEAYDIETAVEAIRRVEPFGVAACEQPIRRDDLEGMAEVRARVSIPLIADESVQDAADLMRCIKVGAADIVKLKVLKHGGIRRTLQMASVAEAAGMLCTIGHGFGLSITTMAEAHLASAIPNLFLPGEMVGPLKMGADIVVPPVDAGRGSLTLETVPGLGIEVNREAFRRYRVA